MRWRLALACLAALLVAACSAARLAYDNADWIIDGWAERYVDFTSDQEAQWQRDLDRALDVHRRRELPRVVAFLHDVERAALTGMDAATLACLAGTARTLFRRHGEMAVDLAVPVLAALDAGQVRELEEAMARRNEEYREKYLDPSPGKRLHDRTERVEERIARWTGPLTPPQLAIIRAEVAAMPDMWAAWAHYRNDRQRRLVELLREGAGEPALRELLTEWWVDIDAHPPALVAARTEVRERSIAMLARLYAAMAPRQHRRLAANVGELGDDLAQAEGGAPAVMVGGCAAAPPAG